MENPPKEKSVGDAAHEIGKAILSAIPAAGGPLQLLFENIFTAPLAKRKQAWLEQLANVITELQQKVSDFAPEKLAANETFITVALNASQIALRNHQKEKLEALRNAVFNSALSSSPDEDLQLVWLRLIDQLTPWHLRILSLVDNTENWMVRNGVRNPGWSAGGVSTVLEHCLPELRGKKEFYEQIVRDLQTEGLVIQGNFLNITMTGHGLFQSRTSGLGKSFMAYISSSD